MTAKEMFLENDCEWIETSWGIWININASTEPGRERLFMIDKKNKNLIWQCEVPDIKLNCKMVKAIAKIIEELRWE